MSWNYRIVKHAARSLHETDWYGIHETYYDADGNVESITENAVGIEGESVEELREVRCRMFEAFKRPVLNYDDLTRHWKAGRNKAGAKA